MPSSGVAGLGPSNAPLSIPTQQMPLVDGEGLAVQVWWRFFYGLFVRNAASVPYLVATDLTATGTVQDDALPLTAEWNTITTVAANTGVLINNFGAGLTSTVWNDGANSLKVYPPIGAAIDNGAIDAPYALAAGKSQVFYQVSDTLFKTVQP